MLFLSQKPIFWNNSSTIKPFFLNVNQFEEFLELEQHNLKINWNDSDHGTVKLPYNKKYTYCKFNNGYFFLIANKPKNVDINSIQTITYNVVRDYYMTYFQQLQLVSGVLESTSDVELLKNNLPFLQPLTKPLFKSNLETITLPSNKNFNYLTLNFGVNRLYDNIYLDYLERTFYHPATIEKNSNAFVVKNNPILMLWKEFLNNNQVENVDEEMKFHQNLNYVLGYKNKNEFGGVVQKCKLYATILNKWFTSTDIPLNLKNYYVITNIDLQENEEVLRNFSNTTNYLENWSFVNKQENLVKYNSFSSYPINQNINIYKLYNENTLQELPFLNQSTNYYKALVELPDHDRRFLNKNIETYSQISQLNIQSNELNKNSVNHLVATLDWSYWYNFTNNKISTKFAKEFYIDGYNPYNDAYVNTNISLPSKRPRPLIKVDEITVRNITKNIYMYDKKLLIVPREFLEFTSTTNKTIFQSTGSTKINDLNSIIKAIHEKQTIRWLDQDLELSNFWENVEIEEYSTNNLALNNELYEKMLKIKTKFQDLENFNYINKLIQIQKINNKLSNVEDILLQKKYYNLQENLNNNNIFKKVINGVSSVLSLGANIANIPKPNGEGLSNNLALQYSLFQSSNFNNTLIDIANQTQQWDYQKNILQQQIKRMELGTYDVPQVTNTELLKQLNNNAEYTLFHQFLSPQQIELLNNYYSLHGFDLSIKINNYSLKTNTFYKFVVLDKTFMDKIDLKHHNIILNMLKGGILVQ